jgi:hypothetical protein
MVSKRCLSVVPVPYFLIASSLALFTETKIVNIVQPEENGPVLIVRFTDRTEDDVLYDGFKITVQDVDLRYMYGEEPNYTAYHLGSNEIVIKYPCDQIPIDQLYLSVRRGDRRSRVAAGAKCKRSHQTSHECRPESDCW